MFKKKALYESKQTVLKSGIKLVNAQAKSMYELLELIKNELAEIEEMIKLFQVQRKLPGLSEDEMQVLSDDFRTTIDRKIHLEYLRDHHLKILVKSLEQYKDKILSINNVNHSESLFVINHFVNPLFSKKDLSHSFFSSATYKQMNEKHQAFEVAQLKHNNLLKFRMHATGALMVGIYIVSFASLLVASIGLCTLNPIAGIAMLCALTAFNIYFQATFSKHHKAWFDSVTEINEKLDLGGLDETLFPELEQLLQFELTASDALKSNPYESESDQHEQSYAPSY